LATPRKADPVHLALSALRHRDRSAAELDARLAERGVGESERQQALETLARSGYVDDERFAQARAQELANRGSGDALIRDDLERRGLSADAVVLALAALQPERERAAQIAARRGRSVKTARYLASRGFGEEALDVLVAAED
jgi:regulatory protein